MKYLKKVSGDRIYLSPLNLEDLPLYTSWLNDPVVMDNIGGNHYNNNLISCKDWFEDKLKQDKSVLFAIVRHDGDEPIGYFEFMEIEHVHRTAIFCMFIGDEANRNCGYGTEALRLAVGYGFDVLNLNNIELKVYSFNERAYSSYVKAGFKEYGRRRQAYYLNGEYYDMICMDILRGEYYTNKSKE
jgi:RimJ/RimL family protein N-acetyltransferase